MVFEIYGVALIAVITGLVQMLKIAGLPKKLLPFASLIFGIILGITYINSTNLKEGIIVGIMMGLSASGLYSTTKNTMEKNNHL